MASHLPLGKVREDLDHFQTAASVERLLLKQEYSSTALEKKQRKHAYIREAGRMNVDIKVCLLPDQFANCHNDL